MKKLIIAVLVVSIILLGCQKNNQQNPQINESNISANNSAVANNFSESIAFPSWANEARIAGANFYPYYTDDEIDNILSKLKLENVTVVIADSPLGWDYDAFVHENEFSDNLNMISRVVASAHKRNIKVVWYLTGLELTSSSGVNISSEHPDWLQVSIEGKPLQFNDISSVSEHWLETGDVDAWVSPESSYREFFINRTKQVASAGVDGLWIDTVYMQTAIGQYDNMWPSYDKNSIEKFKEWNGSPPPARADWQDANWKQWILWRHEDIRDFLMDVKNAVQSANNDTLIFEENWNVDSTGNTAYANDVASYFNDGIATAHEVSTIADRVDLGQVGMENASSDEWLSFITMIKFTRGVDNGKPSWILTYGYQPEDAEKLAAVILANRANYYETQGPVMAGSVGEQYRQRIFSWISESSNLIYGNETHDAEVGVLYSARNRDLLDENNGNLYDSTGTRFFSAYRNASNYLLREHIPFDIVPDTNLTIGRINKYKWLVLPNFNCISESDYSILKSYSDAGGKIIIIGDFGKYDEMCNNEKNYEIAANQLNEVTSDILKTNASENIELEVYTGNGKTILLLANTGKASEIFDIVLNNKKAKKVSYHAPEKNEELQFNNENNSLSFTVPEIKSFGIVEIDSSPFT